MKLFLIRHAEAADAGTPDAPTDFDRPLTPFGHATAAKLADTLKLLGEELDAIVSSPLLRAVQTAEPLLQIATNRQILIDEGLSPEGKKKKLIGRLNQMDVDTVALVGHRPDLDELVSWLIGAGGKSVKLAKGAVAKVNAKGEVREGGGTLVWQLTPDFYHPRPLPAVMPESVPA